MDRDRRPGEVEGATSLADRAAIVDLLTTYAMAIDTKDWDLYESVFSEDAVIDYRSSGGIRGTTKEARDWVAKALEPFLMTQHLVTNQHVLVTGDTATCRSDYYNPMGIADRDGGMRLFFVGGRYEDRLERIDGRWLITERTEVMLWTQGLERTPGH